MTTARMEQETEIPEYRTKRIHVMAPPGSCGSTLQVQVRTANHEATSHTRELFLHRKKKNTKFDCLLVVIVGVGVGCTVFEQA